MLLSFLRILFGLIVACFGAALTQVLFVITPADMAAEPAALGERLAGAGLLTLIAATQMAVFASPFALLIVTFGEWLSLKSPIYYVLGGIAIAMAGYLAQRAGESGEATLANDYALAAFIAAGFAAGLIYWALAGRKAGGPKRDETAPAHG